MKNDAQALSEAAQAAIEAAKSSCPSDLRVAWLGIEGTWKGTHFNRSLRDYLIKQCGIAESDLRSRKRGELAGGGAQEDAARAIEDIATYFDWRPEATRAIFYLGDEALEGGGDKTEQKDIEAANRAIKTAQEVGVTVHTYFGTSKSKFKDTLLKEYARVAHETGGQAFTDQDAIQGFRGVMEKVICGSRNPSLYQTPDRRPDSKTQNKEEETIFPELLPPQPMAHKTPSTLAESGVDQVITHGVKLTGDTLIAPGTSLLLEGQVIEGGLHVIAGLVACSLLGPVGWLVVAANSYSRATTGKNLLQQACSGIDLSTHNPARTL